MDRVCEEYKRRHRQVWPEMTDALRACGWAKYSLFLTEDGLLVGYLEADDFDVARRTIAHTDVNDRWQAEMKQFFAGDSDQRPDQGFLRLQEIFHLD